ncbi:fimbria/pilus periplasmic chaperone [Brevundimonas sp. 2R-24]|uniref:Fimbria/pilus periplasmic chaperone n=1 Tax=Peiella sedimenti TaxID=3061083 RepID=A0ABT8SM52_9CAUL|nr:fimbria/pilus periplasmic chaperone [Caulobacteraceae bacterium XZ-24]
MRKNRVIAFAAASVLCWSAVQPATAIDVNPMVQHITPSGASSGYRLRVRNTDDQPITVEIQAFLMEVDENGRRSLSEEVDDLAIFPPQSVIPPNREQVVQVRYVGPPDPTPRMYLVRVGQLPITFSSEENSASGAAIQVAFNVNTHVLLAPAGARPSLHVLSTRKAENGDVLISVENQGVGFASLREARYALTSSDGRQFPVRAEDVDVGQVSALPGGARRNIRVPAALVPGIGQEVTASIELS